MDRKNHMYILIIIYLETSCRLIVVQTIRQNIYPEPDVIEIYR